MKLKVIALSAISALSLGGAALAQDQDSDGRQRHGGRGGRHDSIEKMTESLNLTPDEKTKIQPIIDQAQPKMEEIHRDAMQKSKAVMDDAMAKIRPLLTADQQKKLDDAQNDRRGGRGGRRGHRGQDGQGGGQDDQ